MTRAILAGAELALSLVEDCAVWTDDTGRIDGCNGSFERLVGRPNDELVGANLIDLLRLRQDDRDIPPDEHPANRVFRQRSELEGTFEAILGDRRIDLELFARRRAQAAVFVVREVTGRAGAERAAHATHGQQKTANLDLESMRLMIEAVRDYAIFTLDQEGYITSWNVGAERIKGYKADEIVGKHFSIFYMDEDRRRDHPRDELRQAKETGRYEEEGWRIRKDGSRFWANIIITAVRDPQGRHIGFTKVTRDFTERRRAEQQMRVVNARLEAANAELESFSYSVSHDLRTPLRALDGFSQALLEDNFDQLDEEGRDYLRRIRTAAQSMGRLIEDMLSLSRISRVELHTVRVDLSALARSIVDDIQSSAPERSVDITIQDGLAAQGDEHLLGQMLRNLLENAWKFTANVPRARIEVAGGQQAREMVLFVRDNGAGFDMTFAERLFSAFERLHTIAEFPGTGIGLAIVRRIAHRHGGRTWADGAVGEGATFYVALPRAETA